MSDDQASAPTHGFLGAFFTSFGVGQTPDNAVSYLLECNFGGFEIFKPLKKDSTTDAKGRWLLMQQKGIKTKTDRKFVNYNILDASGADTITIDPWSLTDIEEPELTNSGTSEEDALIDIWPTPTIAMPKDVNKNISLFLEAVSAGANNERRLFGAYMETCISHAYKSYFEQKRHVIVLLRALISHDMNFNRSFSDVLLEIAGKFLKSLARGLPSRNRLELRNLYTYSSQKETSNPAVNSDTTAATVYHDFFFQRQPTAETESLSCCFKGIGCIQIQYTIAEEIYGEMKCRSYDKVGDINSTGTSALKQTRVENQAAVAMLFLKNKNPRNRTEKHEYGKVVVFVEQPQGNDTDKIVEIRTDSPDQLHYCPLVTGLEFSKSGLNVFNHAKQNNQFTVGDLVSVDYRDNKKYRDDFYNGVVTEINSAELIRVEFPEEKNFDDFAPSKLRHRTKKLGSGYSYFYVPHFDVMLPLELSTGTGPTLTAWPKLVDIYDTDKLTLLVEAPQIPDNQLGVTFQLRVKNTGSGIFMGHPFFAVVIRWEKSDPNTPVIAKTYGCNGKEWQEAIMWPEMRGFVEELLTMFGKTGKTKLEKYFLKEPTMNQLLEKTQGNPWSLLWPDHLEAQTAEVRTVVERVVFVEENNTKLAWDNLSKREKDKLLVETRTVYLRPALGTDGRIGVNYYTYDLQTPATPKWVRKAETSRLFPETKGELGPLQINDDKKLTFSYNGTTYPLSPVAENQKLLLSVSSSNTS